MAKTVLTASGIRLKMIYKKDLMQEPLKTDENKLLVISKPDSESFIISSWTWNMADYAKKLGFK